MRYLLKPWNQSRGGIRVEQVLLLDEKKPVALLPLATIETWLEPRSPIIRKLKNCETVAVKINIEQVDNHNPDAY